MRLFSLIVGCSVANHTDTSYDMDLSNVENNANEIVHCNNPETDNPEMKERVIHLIRMDEIRFRWSKLSSKLMSDPFPNKVILYLSKLHSS